MSAHPAVPEPQPGSVVLVVSPSRVRLVLGGELDLLIKPELLDAVREAVLHDLPVEVDARHVTFMDSSVIATLSRLIQATRHRPAFIDPAPVVRFLLEVTGIGGLVDIVDQEGAAPTQDGLQSASLRRESDAL